MNRTRSGTGSDERTLLVREVFEAMGDCLWKETWLQQRKDPVFDMQRTGPLREAFLRHLEQHWPEWQEEARECSIDDLRAMRGMYQQMSAAFGAPDMRSTADRLADAGLLYVKTPDYDRLLEAAARRGTPDRSDDLER